MDPFSIAFLVASIAASAMSALGQYQQARTAAKTAQATAEYNANLARQEAETARKQAIMEQQKGAVELSNQRRAAQRAMGKMRASMGASGFEMDSGSNLSMLAESAAEHQQDSSVIESNARQAAWAQEVAAVRADNSAGYYDWQSATANNGMTGAYLGMAGTLLGGVAQGVGMYSKLSSAATPTSGSSIFSGTSGVTSSSTYSATTPYSWLSYK